MFCQIINKSKHPIPSYQTEGSSGMDLTANLEEPISLSPGERKLIPTGFFLAIPDGLEAQIRPRSGMAFKKGLTVVNAPGTIDSDYRGEIMVAMINLSNQIQTITDGERVAQMVFAKYEKMVMVETDTLTETVRGEGGFGSTGIKIS
jgi:dUTP pyrophosphatase